MQKINHSTGAFVLGIFTILCTCVFPSWADEYPTRPVNFMVGYAPGGISDLQIRALATAAEPILGQNLMILNKPGATGTTMMALLATSKPDGYTIAICPGSLAITPHFQKVPYDIEKDFTYLVSLSIYSEALLVPIDSPWKTLKDVIDYARQNPNKVRTGVGGTTTSSAVLLNYISKQAGVQWITVPFSGDGEVITNMLGGHIDFAALAGAYPPHVRAGKLRMLAISADERVGDFPDVPTLREVGFDFVALSYQGVMGPKGLPEPIAKKLQDIFTKARNESVYVGFQKKMTLIPTKETGKAFERRMIENYRNVGEYLKK